MSIEYDRESIEALPPKDRPRVRCALTRVDIRQGLRTATVIHREAHIAVDGNNPWLELWAAGRRRPNTNDRHWGHWRWLNCMPQQRYLRALRLWHDLFHRRPRGLACFPDGRLRLNLEESVTSTYARDARKQEAPP